MASGGSRGLRAFRLASFLGSRVVGRATRCGARRSGVARSGCRLAWSQVLPHRSAGSHRGSQRLRAVPPCITVHQISDLTPEWSTVVEGLPVTTPARTFVDLAAVSRRIRLRSALDDARAARKVTLDEVAIALGAVTRRGKPGVRMLGSVLDELGPGAIPAASVLEQRLHAVVGRAGLPALIPQYAFPGRQVVKGCVDGAWPDAMLIVEADSRRWHTRIEDLSRDHLRDQEAARAGWQVLACDVRTPRVGRRGNRRHASGHSRDPRPAGGVMRPSRSRRNSRGWAQLLRRAEGETPINTASRTPGEAWRDRRWRQQEATFVQRPLLRRAEGETPINTASRTPGEAWRDRRWRQQEATFVQRPLLRRAEGETPINTASRTNCRWRGRRGSGRSVA